VSRDGRVICLKIVEGDPNVSPSLCRDCPFKAVNCAHLHFSLRLTSPSPLIVRFNGRTEVWDDESPQLTFEHAACAVKVCPIHHPRACANCSLRQALHGSASETAPQRRVHGSGKVVPFPQQEAVAASA
jgi:hypothetical protein